MKYQIFDTIQGFQKYLNTAFFYRPIRKIILHQLWIKPQNTWKGEKSIIGLEKYYKEQGRSFAFHIAIADNKIWLIKDLNENAKQTGVKEINENSIGLELDSVIGGRKPTKENWRLYLQTIDVLMKRFQLNPNLLYLHREFDSNTPCPDFDLQFLLEELNEL